VEDHFGFQIVLARTEIGGYCSHCQTLRKAEMEIAAAEAPVEREAVRAKVRKSAE
jgi:Fur family ferric uptake transcriptional regulator